MSSYISQHAEGDLATTTRLLSQHDLERGVVSFVPLPDPARQGRLAHCCLVALGKRPGGEGWPQARGQAEHLVQQWVAAERIRKVILVGADGFQHQALTTFARSVQRGGAELLAVFHGPVRAATRRPDRTDRVGADDMLLRAPSAPHEELMERGPSRWLMPRQALRVLGCSPRFDHFGRFSHAMFSTYEALSGELRSLASIRTGAVAGLTAAAVADSDPIRAAARLHGANMALFDRGMFVSNAPKLEPRVVRHDARQAAEIRKHADYASAALAALEVAFSRAQIRVLDRGHVVTGEERVRVAHRLFSGAPAAAIRAYAGDQRDERAARRLFEPSPDREAPRLQVPADQDGIELMAFDRSVAGAGEGAELPASISDAPPGLAAQAQVMHRLVTLAPQRALRRAALNAEQNQAVEELREIGAVKVKGAEISATRVLRCAFLRDWNPHVFEETPAAFAVRSGLT